MDQISQIESIRLLNNKKYREWYKSKVLSKYYSPIVHISFNLGLLGALMIFHFSLVTSWSWISLLLVLFMYMTGNVVVYIVHKYPLHRRYKWWSYPYDTHTVMHHRYFTAETITYESKIDFNAVFFPMGVIAGFALFAQPAMYFGVNYFFNSNFAHVIAGSAAGYFLAYEFFHWASHLPKNHALMAFPWVRFMRDHHQTHHNPRLMNKYNFCIVDPIVDIVMGARFKGTLPADSIEDHYQDVKANLK